jgi:glycine/D-amino acid oxidase-like deaminating enzyme
LNALNVLLFCFFLLFSAFVFYAHFLSMLSFWERESLLRYDYVVVGGGITGLSTAITLKERSPEASVLVLERGLLPSGASTKNAGFACFGSLTEILADMRLQGEDTTMKLIEQRVRGLSMLRQRLGDAALGYEPHGGYELILEKHSAAVGELDRVNALLRGIFDDDVFRLANDRTAAFGFSAGHVRALVHNPFEAQLNAGMMMHGLQQLATAKGITVLTGAEVRHLDETASEIELHVEHNRLHSPKQLVFTAKKVALCTNAFTNRFIHDIDIMPGRGQLFITRPIETPDTVPFRGVFHIDEGYFYFRNISTPEGERILLGGGRNLSPDTEATADFGLSYSIQQYLEDLLRTVIMPSVAVKVEKRWTGIMGFSATKLPIIRKSSERVCVGFGCNGMGIALGSVVGERTAQLMLEE